MPKQTSIPKESAQPTEAEAILDRLITCWVDCGCYPDTSSDITKLSKIVDAAKQLRDKA